jgi:hypothetical protein
MNGLRHAKATRSWHGVTEEQACGVEGQRCVSEHQRLLPNHCHYVGAIYTGRMRTACAAQGDLSLPT